MPIGLRTCPSLICDTSIEFQIKIRKISRCRSCFQKRRTWLFHVTVLQRTATKSTRIYNARVPTLFLLVKPSLWPFIVSRDLFWGIESKLFRERLANMLIIVACKSRKRKRHSKLATPLIKCLI